MDKEEAIKYLERKGKIRKRTKIEEEVIVMEPKKELKTTYKEPKYTKEEKEEIKTAMKEGKLYGDPVARIQWE